MLLRSASKQAAQDAESRKSISLLSKRMDLRREYYSELNRRINEGKEHIRDSFAEFRNTETYKMMLQLLYDKAVSNLGEECSMRIREADIKSIKASQKTKIVTDNTFEGGIVCTSSNGSSMVDYSLSSIMDEVAVKIEPSFSDLISNGDNGAQQHSASARARHAAQSRMSSKK